MKEYTDFKSKEELENMEKLNVMLLVKAKFDSKIMPMKITDKGVELYPGEKVF